MCMSVATKQLFYTSKHFVFMHTCTTRQEENMKKKMFFMIYTNVTSYTVFTFVSNKDNCHNWHFVFCV